MPASTSCPDIKDFEHLLRGPASAVDMERLARHLEQCNHCGETVEQLLAGDTVAEALRGPTYCTDQPEQDVVERLSQRLLNLPAETSERYDFLAPPQGADEIGRLGSYRVLRVLGAGGMGIVFQAEDLELRRSVALKVLRPTLAASAPARQRFRREAQAAAALEHDHIVPIYQVGEDHGAPFLAMQLLQGETLQERLQREGALPVPEVVRIGREIAEGLAAAHAHGLIHRDIKPGNVWLEGNRSRVKILDFGLARTVEDDVHLTRTGSILGTPAYMAPEQARCEPVDARGDLFSLGCVLYHMATGQLPFRGEGVTRILVALETEDPLPPRQLNPALPAALSDLILQLLAKDRRAALRQLRQSPKRWRP